MIQKEITFNNKKGLHGRPAAVLVRAAEEFSAEIKLKKGNKEANLKSILGLLWLKVKDKEKLTLQVEGKNETKAADKIADLIENKLPVVSYQQNSKTNNGTNEKNEDYIEPVEVVKMLRSGIQKNLEEVMNSN